MTVNCRCCGQEAEETRRLESATTTLDVPTNSRVCIALEPKPRVYLHDKITIELEEPAPA